MLVSRSTFRTLLKVPVPVVILGCESLTALGIMRCLGRERIQTLGIAFSDRSSISCYSRYSKVLLLPELAGDVVDLLTRLTPNKQRGVLFCATDKAVAFVDKYGDRLQQNWQFPTSRRFSMEYLLDKSHMIGLARKAGFHVPNAITLTQDRGFAQNSVASMAYPCIVKPVDNLRLGKELYEVVSDEEALLAAAKALLEKCPKVMAQEFIKGGEEWEIDAFRSRFPPHTKQVCTILKHRQYPSSKGSGSFIKTHYAAEFYQPVSRFLDLIEFDGVVAFDVIQVEGRVFFLEVNYRCGVPVALSQKAGLNMPLVAYLDAIGRPVSHELNWESGVYLLREGMDWKHVRDRRISMRQFLMDILRTDKFLIFSIDDLKPFAVFLSRLLKKASRRTSNDV